MSGRPGRKMKAKMENGVNVQQKARERLETEKDKATQKGFAEPIITYLLGRCEEDPGFAEDVMQEDKTWNKCFEYIVSQAKKQRTGQCAAVEDRVVYEWAEDYYRAESKEKSGGKPKVMHQEHAKKADSPKDKKTGQTQDKNIQEDKKTVKKAAADKQQKKKTDPVRSELPGQMTLFDFL